MCFFKYKIKSFAIAKPFKHSYHRLKPIRKPATFEAKEFGGEIEIQDATETGVPVVMDKHLDVSFAVTSKQLTMDIKDFSEQLLIPAMQAFADKVDAYLLGLQSDITNRVPATAVVQDDVIDARAFLTKSAAPLADRRFVYNTDTETKLLKTELFTSAEKVGDAGTALREASLGRKFGMDFYVDQNADSVAGLNGVAFHKNAFALVTRPLALPQGVILQTVEKNAQTAAEACVSSTATTLPRRPTPSPSTCCAA